MVPYGCDCSHEIKRCLFLERKVMTNLDSIFKSRDITLPTKVRLVKAMVFPVVVYECESWTVKKAEHWRSDAFELWCWRRLFFFFLSFFFLKFLFLLYFTLQYCIGFAIHWHESILNCGVGEDSWESLGLQGDPTSPS